MKNYLQLAIIIAMLIGITPLRGQSAEKSKITVNLFIPAFTKNAISPTDELVVFLRPMDGAETTSLSRITTTRNEDNSFEFFLPNLNFWEVAFSIGSFSKHLFCIYNNYGQAFSESDGTLNLILNDGAYADLKFFPPCISEDVSE